MALPTLPQFVSQDGNQVIAEMKAWLEVTLGRILNDGDVEVLIINMFAYRETLLRAQINDTAQQNMVAFARGAALDYLAELVGVIRLQASAAVCTVRFNLIAGHGLVTIPQGNRMQSTDGKFVFATRYDSIIQAGTATVDIDCECTTAGQLGNAYAVGTISVILDPIAFITNAANLDATIGGSDDETDDEFRLRIMLAPNAFSVAGPDGAYEYFAKSASSAIVDVAVTSPTPGEVHIFPLLLNGQLPNQAILDAVFAICNGEKVRPLTDTVIVAAPTSINYAIDISLVLLTGSIDTEILPRVQANMDAYKAKRLNTLGVDVIRTQLSALAMVTGMYNCVVNSPSADIVANPDVYTNCTGINLTITGYHDQ